MKKIALLLLLAIFTSCSTKQYLVKPPAPDVLPIKNVIVIKNPESFIIPVAIYPEYKVIDKYVISSRPAMGNIDELLCTELLKRNISCSIAEQGETTDPDSYYITYQDYWAWDFKKYMHVLKIGIYDYTGKELIYAVSQGNTSGMHDYPNPEKQVPLLVDLILKK